MREAVNRWQDDRIADGVFFFASLLDGFVSAVHFCGRIILFVLKSRECYTFLVGHW
jgi:hypothetical protein